MRPHVCLLPHPSCRLWCVYVMLSLACSVHVLAAMLADPTTRMREWLQHLRGAEAVRQLEAFLEPYGAARATKAAFTPQDSTDLTQAIVCVEADQHIDDPKPTAARLLMALFTLERSDAATVRQQTVCAVLCVLQSSHAVLCVCMCVYMLPLSAAPCAGAGGLVGHTRA